MILVMTCSLIWVLSKWVCSFSKKFTELYTKDLGTCPPLFTSLVSLILTVSLVGTPASGRAKTLLVSLGIAQTL